MTSEPSALMPVAEARRRVLDGIERLGSEWVSLERAAGRVLGADLEARRTQPPSAVSSMDGYAVIAADTAEAADGTALTITGEARAGGAGPTRLERGEAVRIFTGGTLPAGADAIAIQENATVTTREDGRRTVRFSRPSKPGEFVREAGLDFRAGTVLLRAGRKLDGRSIALAASMGHGWLPVVRRPRIALLATGDELVRPGDPLGPGSIVSTNSLMLMHVLRAWGAEPVDLGIAGDTRDALELAVQGTTGLDLLVTSGGASVGDYDLVRGLLGHEGSRLDFWKIAMRPGKPLLFGHLGQTRFLGLPGNPVSTAVCALVFIRAMIMTMLGRAIDLPVEALPLAAPLRANDEREDYVRATLEHAPGGARRVRPANRQDSSMFALFSAADALIIRPPMAEPLLEGTLVPTIPIDRALQDT